MGINPIVILPRPLIKEFARLMGTQVTRFAYIWGKKGVISFSGGVAGAWGRG